MSESTAGAGRPLPAGVESRPGLIRVLGPWMAIALVVGNVIGSGIFLKPGAIAAVGGSFPLIITAWITGGCLCILGGLCFAELAVMLPRAGGMYVYLREAYGRETSFLFGWSEFLFRQPASVGALAVAFVTAFGLAVGHKFTLVPGLLLALSLIVGMAWVNIIGTICGGRVQAGTTLIKAGFLALIAILPFAVMLFGFDGFDTSNYITEFAAKGGESRTLSMKFAAVMLAVMWAYNGWHGITPVAEEIRDPQRNIPRALFGGIGVLIVLYLGANFAYHGVLTMDEMAAAGESGAQETMRKLFASSSDNAANVAVAVISAVIMISTFGAINSNMLNGPRVSFAMGRDDVFFRQLGRVHVNFRTPAIAITVQASMAALLVVASGILVTYVEGFENTSIFTMLTDYVIFSASIFYMLAVLAVIVLRVKHPEWERPYRTWGYPFVPILYLSFYAWFLYNVYLQNPFEAKSGLLLIALGLPVYYGYRAWAKRHPDKPGDGQ